MKCIAAVVMMAFLAYSQASVTPLVYSAPLLNSYAYPLAVPAISQYSSIPASTLYASHATPVFARQAPWDFIATPNVIAAPRLIAPAPIAYTAIPGEAKYTAINRGALHEAPLPGHALSQTSLNLAPSA